MTDMVSVLTLNAETTRVRSVITFEIEKEYENSYIKRKRVKFKMKHLFYQENQSCC
jgi:hypothetical protein